MKVIEQIRIIPENIEIVWSIISDLSRCDWVPGVSKIILDSDTRIFKMDGMGDLIERIIKCDESSKELHYSAIKTAIPINHHLAKIKLEVCEEETKFIWISEIDPEHFAKPIENGMLSSLDQLEVVIKKTT